MDLEMPKRDGFEATRSIRQWCATAAGNAAPCAYVPIVAITAATVFYARLSLPLAVNDPAGVWKLKVRELLGKPMFTDDPLMKRGRLPSPRWCWPASA